MCSGVRWWWLEGKWLGKEGSGYVFFDLEDGNYWGRCFWVLW